GPPYLPWQAWPPLPALPRGHGGPTRRAGPGPQRRRAVQHPLHEHCPGQAPCRVRAEGVDVRDEDVARLSPFIRKHINMLDRRSFSLPEMPEGLRPLGAPDSDVDETEK